MTDWPTVASLVSAGSTLVLSVATFSAIRSANRSAKAAEQTVLSNLRPVLAPSRLDDRNEKIIWMDGHQTLLGGGLGYAEPTDDRLYLALSLRNVGNGLAVLQGWEPSATRRISSEPHAEVSDFRPLTRDLYIPAGDVSYWHAMIHDQDDPAFAGLAESVQLRRPLGVDLLYTDHEGGQRTISRFALHPHGRDDQWIATVSKHWYLDRPDPR